MTAKFSAIIADCPWIFSDTLKMSSVPRGAEANYPVLTTEELCKLPIQQIADPDGCVLALWVVGSMLEDGMKVMNSWGFKQKQVFVWVKTKKEPLLSLINLFKNESIKDVVSKFSLENILSFGMGRLFRQTHEICLIGINNNKIYKKLNNKSQRSVCFEPNFGHSIKPDTLHARLDAMFAGPKIELFARRQRDGWLCIGNEMPSCAGEDIRDSVNKLICK